MKKIIALIMATLLVVGILAACGNGGQTKTQTKTKETKATEAAATVDSAATADSATPDAAATVKDYDAVKAAGKLVVGITDFAPMDYKDENGNWIGYDAELATAFAESLGVPVEFVEVDWDNKILELDGGTVDCIWNGMTLTDEVTSAMSCTEPYLGNSQVIVVNKDDAEKYADADSCKELNFAVESGSAGQEQAEEYKFTFTEVKDQATALMEVASGACDAAIIDLLMAKAMVGEGTGYEQLAYTASLNEEEYGVGFRKGSDLTAMCNEFFHTAKTDGTTEALIEKYIIKK